MLSELSFLFCSWTTKWRWELFSSLLLTELRKKKPSAYMSHKDCSAHCPGLHINFHISEPSAANGHPSLLAQPTPLAGSVQSGFPSSEIKQLRIKQLLKGEGQFLGAALKKAEEEQRGSSVHWSRLHTSPLLSYEKSCLTTASWDQSMNKAGKSPVKMGGGFKCFSVRKRSSLCSVSCNLPKRLLFLVPPAVPFLTLHSPSWA